MTCCSMGSALRRLFQAVVDAGFVLRTGSEVPDLFPEVLGLDLKLGGTC